MAEPHSTGSPEPADPLRARLAQRLAARRAAQMADAIRPRRSQGPAPLSFPQTQLWLVDRLAPGGSAYNIARAFDARGALDVAALAGSLEEIVRRHEVLRTTFTGLPDGQPLQVIAARPLFALPVIDLCSLGDRAAAAAAGLAGAEAARPFDLERGPVVRTALMRLAPEHHVLLLTLHHIAADGWSMQILYRELATLYAACAWRGTERTGAAAPTAAARLAPLSLQYADWAVWQRRSLAGERGERLLAVWREALAGAPESLDLPADRPRPPVQSFRGAMARLALGPGFAQPVHALARRQRATPFMVLLAAWQALLGRLTGQLDLVVGTPVAGRTRSQIEELIGCFVNIVPLRGDLAQESRFSELLARTRDVALAALEHQEMPFERLVEELAPQRDLSRNPLVQVTFELQRGTDGRLELPGLAVRRLPVDHVRSKFDLSLTVIDGEDGFAIGACYARDLFDGATATRWVGHFRTLLAAALADPEQPVAELPLLTLPERQAVLRDWSDGGAPPSAARGDATLHRMVEAQVERTPGAVAIVWAPENGARVELSYAALDRRAGRLARRLAALGVGPEIRVGVALERTAELPVALLGILKAGGAYVPLDPSYPPARLAMMINDARQGQGGFVLLTQERLLPRLSEVVEQVLATAGEPPGTRDPVHVLCVDAPDASLPSHPEISCLSSPEPTNLAYLIYTSGSTGRPKGVAIEHRSAAAMVRWARDRFSAEELAGVFASTSINFDLSVFELFVPLACGGRVILGENALALAGSPAAAEVTLINTVPSAITELLRLGAMPPSVRTVNLAGEPLRGALVERLYALGGVERVWNLYGPSEDTTYSTFALVPRDGVAEPTIGRAIAGSRAYALDRALQPCPSGVPGELCLGGAGLARGYLYGPELTAEQFVPDPFAGLPGARLYRTGDLARWLPSGELEFLGRIDHQVKVRGFRIELGEIEAALLRHTRIAEAVVVAREDRPAENATERLELEKRLAAYVVPRREPVVATAQSAASLSLIEELRAWLVGQVPDYMVPSAFVVLEVLPRTPNGKLDRKALPVPTAAAVDRWDPPRTPSQELLAGIWCEVLGRERIGVHDGFFALGGHSLLAARVVSRVRGTFGIEVPLRRMFEAPTVAALAAEIEALRTSGTPAAPPIQRLPRDRPLVASSAQERLWFLDQLQPGSPAYNLPLALRLRGRLDLALLAACLDEIVRRHEALRTTFKLQDGRPVQVVAAPASWPLPVADLSALEPVHRESEARRLRVEEGQRPFDLAGGPLLRTLVVRVDADDHVMLLTQHHIVTDDWSIGVLLSELEALYRALAARGPSPLAELPIQYADYAQWQRAWLAGEVLEEQLAFWRRHLAGAPAVLDLPTDRPRPPRESFRGATRRFDLSAELSARMRALARREGATVFMTLLAGFEVLLHRLTGQDDLVVGTPIANRTRIEVESLIGFFVNTLAMRIDLSGDASLRELIGRVRETALEAYAHQDLPFEKLVDELQPERDLSRSPIFQVLFQVLHSPRAAFALPNLAVERIAGEEQTAKFDLALSMSDTAESLAGIWGYRRDLFDASTIARLEQQFQTLLEGVAAHPEWRLSELPLLTARERQQLWEWNAAEQNFGVDLCLHELIARQAERTPDAIAVSFEGEELSYGELQGRARRLAHRLRALGVGPEVRVGICAERSLELVVGLVGILEAGGAYVPLDPSYPRERLAYLMDDAQVAVLLTQERLLASLPGEAGQVLLLDAADEPANGEAAAAPPPWTGVGPDNLAYVIYTSGSTGKPKGAMNSHRGIVNRLLWMQERYGLGPTDRVLQKTPFSFDVSVWEFFAPLLAGGRLVVARPGGHQDPAYLVETLVREQITTVHFVPSMLQVFLEAPGVERCTTVRRVIASGEALPPELEQRFFVRFGSTGAGLHNLYGPTEAAVEVTHWECTPGAGRWVVPIGHPVANTQIHLLGQYGEPVPVGVVGELNIAGVQVARGYLGRPELTAERFVPDPFSSRPGARIYRTGDLARRRVDGAVEYLGRLDHQIKIRGFRIELGEIEAALAAHPAVAEAVVVARDRGQEGGQDKDKIVQVEKRLVAYLVLRREPAAVGLQQSVPGSMAGSAVAAAEGSPTVSATPPQPLSLPEPFSFSSAGPSVDQLRSWLAATLPEYMVPSAFMVLDALPLSPNGKIDRKALPEPEEPADSAREMVAPRTALERELAALFQEVLRLDAVGVHDDFFMAGGNSIQGASLVNRLQQRLGEIVHVAAIFDAPTVARLAARLQEQYPAAVARLTGETPARVADYEAALDAITSDLAAVPGDDRSRGGSMLAIERTGWQPGTPLPLSFQQERLWVLDRLQPGLPTYNLSAAWRIDGELDVAAFRVTLAALVRRHAALRTTLVERDGHPCQVIAPAEAPASRLPVVDLSSLRAEAACAAEARRLAAAEARRPFDLAMGPLLRTALLRLGTRAYVFAFAIHHVVADGWSVGILLRELAACYGALAESGGAAGDVTAAAGLAPLPVQYADYAVWQRRWLSGKELEQQAAYWRERLAGAPPLLELPLDRARPAVQTVRGEVHGQRLSAEAAAALQGCGRREGVTLFMVLLAGLSALLGRLAGQEDVLIGAPVAGRNRADVEGLVGCFLNSLVLRTNLAATPSFRMLLAQVRETTLSAFAHQDLPFEKLLEELQPPRTLAHTPLFQVFLNVLNFPAMAAQLPGLSLELLAPHEVSAKFDLTLYVAEDAGGLLVNWVYNSDLFDRARIEETARQLALLLAQAVAEPDRPVGELALLTLEARRVLPDPTADLDRGWLGSVPERFAAFAARAPELPAISDPVESWTYGELAAYAHRLAWRLAHGGVEKGDFVAIWAHRSAPLVPALLAALETGAAFVVLDPAYPAARLADMVLLAPPAALLAVEAAGPVPEEVEAALAEAGCRCRLVLPPRRARRARDPAPGEPEEPLGVELTADDPAYVAFTSGSTGRPKAILGRHGSLSHFIPWRRECYGLSERDRFSLLSGLAHDPLHRDVFAPLLTGGSIAVPDPERVGSAGYLAAWLREERVTVANLTPAMGQLVAQEGGTTRLPALRLAFVVGDVLTRRDVRRLNKLAPDLVCVNHYGSTETQQALGYYVVPPRSAGAMRADDDQLPEVLPLGRGIPDVQLLVVNAAGAQAGIGEVGEIWVRSPHVALGYLGEPERTAEKFVINPWTGAAWDVAYRTGDLGRYLPGGDVAFAGRVDQQVKVRGFRVELGEVESVLGRHPAVREVAVVAKGAATERHLVAYFVAAAAGERDEELITRLREYLKERLPDYTVPAAWMRLAALPLTPNGKLDRRALPEPEEPAAAGESVAPRSLIEELLVDIWREVLRRERVGIHDNFFDLGGHSLLAARVASRVREAFGVEVPLRRMFAAPTLAALAAEVAAQRSGGVQAAPRLERIPRDRAVAASFGQERLWFLDQLEPENAAYNMVAAWVLRGRLDVAALAAAVDEVVRRHEALRTVFEAAPHGAMQHVLPHAPSLLPLIDLRALPAGTRHATARALVAAEAARGFDLARGPLFRRALLRLTGGGAAAAEPEHLLVVILHHIVTDGWSQGILVTEVAALYNAFVTRAPGRLPELPVQYADFAAWQRSTLTTALLERQVEFWRQALTGAPALLELPTDRPRPAVQTFRGGRLTRRLPEPLAQELKATGRREGATPFMVLLAAFQALLSRHTGTEDVAVGTPVAGRSYETEKLIGLFVNTLVLRGDLAGDPSFAALLARVRETALDAFTHQDLPFEKLVERLRPERALAHSPLFQVMFVLQNLPPAIAAMDGLHISSLDVHTGTAKFDLTLTLVETTGGDLVARLEYNRDLFDVTTAERLLAHYQEVLAAVAMDASRRFSELRWLTVPERHQLVAEWNDSARDYEPALSTGSALSHQGRVGGAERPPRGRAGGETSLEACLHELIAAQSARTPEAVAVAYEGETLTYAALAARSNQLARYLVRLGVGPESLVGVAMERSVEMVVALLGVLEAGGAYVPIDPSYPAERLAFMLEDALAGASRPILLTQKHVAATLPLDELRGRGGHVLALDTGWEEIARERNDALPARSFPYGPAYMIYTSGSTGRPKGAVNTHGAIVNRLLWMQEAFGLGPDDRVLQKTPFSFDVSVWEFFWPLLVGARLVVARPGGHQDARYLAELIAAEGVTTLHFVPSMLQAFLGEPEAARCRSLRRVVCSGEALAPELVGRFFERLPSGPELHNLYGPTEAAVDVTWWPCSRADAGAGVPIGRPIANLGTYVVDRDLRPVAMGVAGELLLGGVGLARGYHARPDLTAERFVPNPFAVDGGGPEFGPGSRLYRTGDLARLRTDGAVDYLGRLDHQIKLRGFRIELGEIEAALRAHPAVAEAAVVARGRDEGDQQLQVEKRLVAYVVPRRESAAAGLPSALSGTSTGAGEGPPVASGTPAARPSLPESLSSSEAGLPNELRTWLAGKLPEYMVPSAFVLLEALPLSPNGKLDRRALPAPGRSRAEAAALPPRNAVEGAIAQVWRRVLRLEAVGVEDNFFDLGGHSLLVIEVQRELRQRFPERDLSVVDLFKYPTIAALAAHVAGESAAAAAEPAAEPAPALDDAIAIVGMAGRFPGAASVAELWRRLCAGEELIRSFTEAELLAAGVDPELVADPRYVRARGVVEGTDLFDARFFDCSPREAELIDPQQRIFLECAFEALEDAGHGGERPAWRPPRVGAYAGVGENGYVLHLYADRALMQTVGHYQVSIGNKSDYLPTRVSYKLDLKGPSVSVQTACSTSLVAVHLACRALLAGECDLALAGGVSIAANQTRGYLYDAGHILSPDGHCRAFDAGAGGTVVGGGAGVVVLRRLAEALADGDRIDAVILGSAINNDGAGKVGFTAPSVEGQAAVIRAAHRQAGIDPGTIGYVEAHGTGTRLGDPIEVRALAEAFGEGTGRRGGCGLGSVKTNLGHLDAAAGVAGLIKAALAVKHGVIPPSLHFERPNPELGLEATPFRVVGELRGWQEEGRPRRAGVSSFGIGGTNAHVVLEQAPQSLVGMRTAGGDRSPSRPWQLLLLSAKSAAALDAATARLAGHLERHPELDLADVAHTLRVGRRTFTHRRAIVCRDRAEAVAALRGLDPAEVLTHAAARGSRAGGRPVAFLFPGQGAQHPGMGAELYREEPVYREALDRCCALFASELGFDLRELLHGDGPAAAERLLRTEVTQPALFAVEWALAQLWSSWGVKPQAMLGHSIGEYVAACLAGVFTLEEAVTLVAARGRLMGSLPTGAMLAVALPEGAATERVAAFGGVLALAVVSSPMSSVVAGPEPAVESLREDLAAEGVDCRRLHTSHAFHSPMVEPILPEFGAAVRRVALQPPAIPFLSNLTGTWITAAEATDPDYWVRHLRGTVRFADGLAALVAAGDQVLLEVGPGRTLTTLAAQHPERARIAAVASLRHPRDARPEQACLLTAAARLWLLGATVDWRAFAGEEARRRVPLPTYPFERRRYWVDPPPSGLFGRARPQETVRTLARTASMLADAEPESANAGGTADDGGRPELQVAFVAPRDETERRIAGAWRDVLGVERIGVHDDFFDLGGSSLLGARLTTRMRDVLAVEVPPHLLLEATTVAALARHLAPAVDGGNGPTAATAASRHPCLAELHAGGRGKPLFLVHPAGGHLYWFRDLAAILGEERPVLGLRARGLAPGEEPLASVEAMADLYLAAVREASPTGPYLLGGASMGGMVAYELAQRLRAAGEEVALLALFDTYGPGEVPAPGPAGDGRPGDNGHGPRESALDPAEERRVTAVLRASTAAMRAYRPRPYAGRLVFFRAAERRPGEPVRPEEAWVDLAGDGAEVHVVPGDHASMHQRPQVDTLARRLRPSLILAGR